MFDDISYKKGCCILKMLMDEMGEDNFFGGLKLYMGRHEFGNTESKDLWRAFQDCGDPRVTDKMRVWTKEAGFPVVSVTEDCAGGGSGPGEVVALRLHQKRFVVGGAGHDDGKEQIYPLRISMRSETGIDIYDMEERETVIPAQGKTLLKINADHSGFFRTSYTSNHLRKLTRAAVQGHLTLRDCIGLLADLSALTATGMNKTSELLDLCLGFKSMTEFPVWQMIDRNLTKLVWIWKFEDSILAGALAKFAADILGLKAHELGWTTSDADDESQMIFQATMFGAAGLAGDLR